MARRGAVRHRYGCLEVAYLLQKIEDFFGLSILTPNMRRLAMEKILRR